MQKGLLFRNYFNLNIIRSNNRCKSNFCTRSVLLEIREAIGHEVKRQRGLHRPYFVSRVNPFFILLYFIRKKTIYSFLILVYPLQIIQDTLSFWTISAKKVGKVFVCSQMSAPCL